MSTSKNTIPIITILTSIVIPLAMSQPVFSQALPTFTPEGRPTAGVQVGNPTPDANSGVTFEKNRIKRTPQLLPKTAISESRWDLLYSLTEPTGPKVAYFDWDNDFIYIAWESPKPEDVRFDLDGSDDGFLRGADNLRVQINTPISLDPDSFSTSVPFTAELWDGTKNGDRPVRTPAPLPLGAIQAVAGKSVTGTYVLMVAIGKTELTGLRRDAGRKIGLRIESGVPVTAPDGTTLLSNQPFVHLVLSDRVEAKEQDIWVSLKILSGKELVAGDGIRAILEARNDGATPVALTRLFMRGSQASLPFVDSVAFTGLTLGPGQTTKRELRSIVVPTTPTGTHVITGGAEWTAQNGAIDPLPTKVAALASFDRVEPYFMSIFQPKQSVLTSPERSIGGSQTVTVTVHSRVRETARTEVAIRLPAGWSVEGREGTNRILVMRGAGDERQLRFKVQIPSATTPGQYVVEATANVEGKMYSTATTINVETLTAPKAR